MWAVDTPSARRDQTRGSACSRKSLKNSTVHFVFLPQTHLNMYAENVPNATFARKQKNTNAWSNSNISLASIQKCSLSCFWFFFFCSCTFHLIIHHTAHCISLNAATMLAAGSWSLQEAPALKKRKKGKQTVKKTNTPRPGGRSRVRTH